MKQLTLVSLYGPKPEPLARLIRGCTDIIQSSPLGRVFLPYQEGQVHGTIVGMEKLEGHAGLFNANMWLTAGTLAPMDFEPLLPVLRRHLPMTFQFGGFPPAFDAFDSFGRRPYERSFQIQWPAKRATLIGWPHCQGEFAPRRLLNSLRDELAANCNLRHKWGADNDLFMVLGEIAIPGSLSAEEFRMLESAASGLEKEVRDYLAAHKTEVAISCDELAVVQYKNATLAPGSSVPYRITAPGMDAGFIRSLYE